MIPSSWSGNMAEWIRQVATQVNPSLQGYPFAQLDTAPANPLEGFTYYDTALNTVRTWDGSTWASHTGGGGGSGTVTSVAMTVPTGFSVSGSPVTSSGTLALSYAGGYQGYTSAEATKLAGIASGATANTGTVTSVAASVPTGFSITGSPITTTGTLAITYTAGYQGYTSAEATKLAGVATGATANTGTVTSINASGGTTGYSFTGGPVTSSGTLTMTGTPSDLGTPTTGTLTNCTGLPISTGVSGLGTGVATFLATPSSANLAAAVTDEDGTGSLPFESTGTWTPTVSSPAGAPTTYSSSGSYTKIGRMVFVSLTINITTNGPAATFLTATLPFTAGTGVWAGTGYESALTGSTLSSRIASGAGSTSIVTYNNAYPGGTGAAITVSISYFV